MKDSLGQVVAAAIEPARIHHTMRIQIGLTSPEDVDPEVRYLLAQAYLENS